jgi:hypothetical protein
MTGFTHHSGVSLSNLVSSNATLGTQTATTLVATTVRATTRVTSPLVRAATVHGTTKLSAPTINATTAFNLKSLLVKATKGYATYGALSNGGGYVPAAGDVIVNAFQWKYSSAVLKSASQITATTKVKGTGILSFAAPLLSGSVVLVQLLDVT